MSTFSTNPLRNPADFDVLIVAGVPNPGIVKITGFDRTFGWDVKKGKGTKGATITLTEFPPAEGSAEFYLWTDDHFDQWTSFRDLFRYDVSKRLAPAVDVYHPWLADLNINSVVCKKISPVTDSGKKLFVVKVDLLEYWPPPKAAATSTPSGSKTGSGGKNGPPGKVVDPVEAAKQAEIARLLAEAKKL